MYRHNPLSETRVQRDTRWVPLRLVNIFRGGIALSLLVAFLVQPEPDELLGAQMPQLFLGTVVASLLLCAVATFMLYNRSPRSSIQAIFQLGGDVVIYLLLVQASGGLESGLGNLLVIPIIAASLIMGQRLALSFAALATLGLLAQQILITLSFPEMEARYTHAGVLGALFMLLAVGGTRVARQLRESEALAARRGLDLRNLEELNDYIIHHLRTGIVVVDHEDRLQLMNGAAGQFLGVSRTRRGAPIAEVSQQLADLVEARRERPWDRPPSFTAHDGETVIIPRFTELGPRRQTGTLIFLEDSSLETERAQEMKLAALGRFTASIAHELRNPLGAISHAQQLLSETEPLTDRQRHLLDIIDRHGRRLNRIIETVLKLSRRETTEPRPLELQSWLEDFVSEMVETGKLRHEEIRVENPETPVEARMDRDQLHQVMTNLVDNALNHGESREDGLRVLVRLGYLTEGRRPFLEVTDFGPGISEREQDRMFEPFYTATTRGTGLGLFVARELCDANRAKLEYRDSPEGCTFRIRFSDPERWLT